MATTNGSGTRGRYPRGESYLDVMHRLDPIFHEMERHRVSRFPYPSRTRTRAGTRTRARARCGMHGAAARTALGRTGAAR